MGCRLGNRCRVTQQYLAVVFHVKGRNCGFLCDEMGEYRYTIAFRWQNYAIQMMGKLLDDKTVWLKLFPFFLSH